MARTREWLYAWLLLLPAAALLALFTHYPAVANLWHSLYSTPKAARPPKFIGLDNYRALIDDPIFWQALVNNFWYALGTIPISIVGYGAAPLPGAGATPTTWSAPRSSSCLTLPAS